eukprot:5924405-Pleurochrysis_carterae.AAC.1
MEDREMTINAPPHSKSGVRTSKLGYEDHLSTMILRFRVAAVEFSSGRPLLFNFSWKRGDELPPFIVNNEAAVAFLRALVDSDMGTRQPHTP